MHLVIKDDSGIFEVFEGRNYDTVMEMVLAGIDHLIDWFEGDNEVYDEDTCDDAVSNLEGERDYLRNGFYDTSAPNELFVVYGFTFEIG